MKRKKRMLIEQGEVNVVSLMDVLTTMLFFLILMASTTNFATLFSSSALAGKSSDKDNKQQFDLVVTYQSSRVATIYLGPFNELKAININDFTKYINRYYRKRGAIGYAKKIFSKSEEDLKEKITTELKRIKQAFPHEEKLTLAVGNKIKYQEMIHMLHQMMMTKDNDYFETTNLIGQTRLVRTLFPNVTIQELGDKSVI